MSKENLLRKCNTTFPPPNPSKWVVMTVRLALDIFFDWMKIREVWVPWRSSVNVVGANSRNTLFSYRSAASRHSLNAFVDSFVPYHSFSCNSPTLYVVDTVSTMRLAMFVRLSLRLIKLYANTAEPCIIDSSRQQHHWTADSYRANTDSHCSWCLLSPHDACDDPSLAAAKKKRLDGSSELCDCACRVGVEAREWVLLVPRLVCEKNRSVASIRRSQQYNNAATITRTAGS